MLGEGEVRGKIVVADALHTQCVLSRQIVERGGEYVWTVNENQPVTDQTIELMFNSPYPLHGWGFRTVHSGSKG